ncbi:MAG: carbohydrate ABC transporter permease [Treponema sp.]|jgi:multiple sugar transport system permease protein|nr:carbohydrate ABC transporter permease [Treponema sp.]
MRNTIAGLKRPLILNVVIYAMLFMFILLFFVPIVWLGITSFKPREEIYIPALTNNPNLVSYRTVLTRYAFDKYFFNSLVVAIVTTALVAIVAVLGAYGFTKHAYPGSKRIFFGCVILRMLPFITLMLPLYIYVSRLRLMNTKTALVIANTIFNLPLALWILESYFRSLPDEMLEAAKIDGASRIGVLLRIVVPVSGPSISTAIILTFLNTWNEFLFAFVTAANDRARTMTVGIALLSQQYGIRWDLMTAAGMLYMIPMLVFVICFQKYIISGLTLGAVKG